MDDTAGTILATAAALLHRTPFDDLSYRVLGDAVGISERTVYRYFPTRSHLLTGLARRLDVTELPFPAFRTAAGLHAAVRERFRAFDAAPRQALVVARSAAISPVEEPEPDFLTHALLAMLETERPGLNPRDTRRAVAALRSFASASFWAHARLQWGLDADAAADVVERVTTSVLEVLAPAPAPAARSAEGVPR